MAKILAILSKDNQYDLYIQDGYTGSIQKMATKVDATKDDVFDERDCFGNDFEFYIIPAIILIPAATPFRSAPRRMA